ncbi:MAG: hypothetical protein M3460_19230 [Actinomycetota bacterium]|nr:hypothetical protein [Actinomycetota bacterium]
MLADRRETARSGATFREITGSGQNGRLGYRVCRARVITAAMLASNPANQVRLARSALEIATPSSASSMLARPGTVRRSPRYRKRATEREKQLGRRYQIPAPIHRGYTPC